MTSLRAAIFIFLTFLTFPASAADEKASVDFSAVVAEIIEGGEAALAAYDPVLGDETGEAFSDLYFDVFEGSGMEMAVGLKDGNLKTVIESLFAQTIGHAMKGEKRETVATAWAALRQKLEETASAQAAQQSQAESGFWSVAIQAFLILVREGFEAMLVVTALTAYLRRSGATDKIRHIWSGVLLALVASAATAWALQSLFKISGQGQEALEGVTMLIAAGVLFYVSYWLFAKREAERWQAYVRKQIDKALDGNSLFALSFAAFLAVYREGAETVLFYQALMAGSDGQTSAIFSGFIAAVIVLAGLYWAMRTASIKLPLGVFFSATALLLYVLSVIFAGKGMLELQEAGWVGITPISWIPNLPWAGLFPTLESVAAQALLLAPLPFALLWFAHKRRTLAKASGAAE